MNQKKTFTLILLVVVVLLASVILYGITKNSSNNYDVDSLVENSNTTYLNVSELNADDSIEASYVQSTIAVPGLIDVTLPSEFNPTFEWYESSQKWYPKGEEDYSTAVSCSFGLTTGTYEETDEYGVVSTVVDEGTIDEQLYELAKYFGVDKVNVNTINGTKWYTIVVNNYKDENTSIKLKKAYYNYTEKDGNVFLLSYEMYNDIGKEDMTKAIQYHNDILTSFEFK